MKNKPIPSIDKDASLKVDEVGLEEEESENEKRGKVLFILGTVVAILILGGVVTLAVFYFKAPKKEEKVEVQVSPTTMPTTVPTIALNKEEVSFEVLNGSGKSGEAARIKSEIEALGYKVDSIGNAGEKVEGMKLYLSTRFVDQKDLLVTDLKREYSDLEYIGELEDSDVGARIIVGF